MSVLEKHLNFRALKKFSRMVKFLPESGSGDWRQPIGLVLILVFIPPTGAAGMKNYPALSRALCRLMCVVALFALASSHVLAEAGAASVKERGGGGARTGGSGSHGGDGEGKKDHWQYFRREHGRCGATQGQSHQRFD
jgi:hypothetical protein